MSEIPETSQSLPVVLLLKGQIFLAKKDYRGALTALEQIRPPDQDLEYWYLNFQALKAIAITSKGPSIAILLRAQSALQHMLDLEYITPEQTLINVRAFLKKYPDHESLECYGITVLQRRL